MVMQTSQLALDQNTTPVKKAQDSPLLHLPSELLHWICKYAFDSLHVWVHPRSADKIESLKDFRAAPHEQFKSQFGLPSTCRQLYLETALLPYQANMFDFTDLAVLCSWLKVLPQKKLEALKKMEFFLFFFESYVGPDAVRLVFRNKFFSQPHICAYWKNLRQVHLVSSIDPESDDAQEKLRALETTLEREAGRPVKVAILYM